jgi:hypothetical protein
MMRSPLIDAGAYSISAIGVSPPQLSDHGNRHTRQPPKKGDHPVFLLSSA